MSEETLKQHVAAMERGARCAICPLYGCGQGPVMPEVRLGALLTIIGEAPHTTEVEEGRTFAGATSEVLTATLPEVGVARQDCTYTNAILCRPPGGHMLDFAAELNKKHKKAVAKARAERVEPPPLITPQECCAPRLERDIADSESRVLLALGSEGLKAAAHAMKLPYAGQKAAPGTARVTSIKKQHGSPVLAPDGRVLVSSLHPVFAGYGNNAKFMPVIREDLKRAGRIAKRGAVIDWYEPEFIIKPSHDTCINVMERMLRARALVTVDIETDGKDPNTCGIRCVGLGAVIDGQEVVIVIPLRHMDGRRWWSPADEQRIENALRELLEANPLAGQNLLFDTCVLLRLKLLITRGKRWFDTMLAHHNTSQSELPHDLGFIAARNFEAPRWKEDADAKSIDGVDDYWLHLYCCKDVLGEMRLVDPLARQVNEEGTALALKTDTILAPTARDMGVLGLNIDEDRRRKFFDILDAKVSDQATKLKLVTGNPDFNPNAFKQVADFLYIKKGLSPPYATDGREWEELEDDEELEIDTDDPEVILAKAATNELALLRLLELGVDEQTRQFIEGELFYRGLQKCKSTYVGLKAEDENGARVIVDTHRKKGYLQTEFWLGKRHSILHPSWKLHITPTGRWATSPNVQNWPERIVFDIELYKATERIRAAEMAEFGKPKTPEAGILNTRAMVVAPDEHILVGADYAAIELRLYAAMSGDALLLDAILHGKDPHALNYATMQSRHPGDLMKWYDRVMTSSPTVKKYLRIIAKRFGFLVIYGGQKDKLYRTMASDRNPDGTRSFPDLKPADVEMWFDNWHRMHPETKRWHEAVVRAWSRHGFVATILDGRRRFFLGGMDMTAMPNMTIQGSAASIANRAMIRVAEQCPHRGWSDLSGPVLQVHDFIGLQVPLKRQKEAEQLLMREMPYEYNGMKYEVEQKSGLSWDKT